VHEDLLQRAAKEDNPFMRLALVTVHMLSSFNLTKGRTKKPFNPMLGETYELVTEDFRFIAEQVSHHPPISAYMQEGRGYSLKGFLD
jgi:hypothetical protein